MRPSPHFFPVSFNGQVAAALMAKAPELLAKPPVIKELDVLAAKLTQ
jgi:hypothetical protein